MAKKCQTTGHVSVIIVQGMEAEKLTEHGVDTPIVLRVVCDLCILPEDDLSARCDHTELGNVDLDDRTLRHDTELRVHRRLRILLNTDDLELECCLQISYVGVKTR